jgi:hypothetical protein
MRLSFRVLMLATLAFLGCHTVTAKDFVVPPAPDARVELDLGTSAATAAVDMTCINSACGGCSSWVNYDGTPSKVGDPCLLNGVYQCTGTELKCTSNSCLGCTGGTPVGSVCGADGHTIIELHYSGTACVAYDFGSAIDVCNHSANDSCQQKCTANGTTYDCVAHCASDDGGGTGCTYQPTETCESLTSC